MARCTVARLMLCAVMLGAGCASEKWLDDQVVDLGDRLVSTEEKKPVIHTFQIRNPRTRTIQIEKEGVSCGCTNAELDRPSIGPGEVALLKLSVDPSNQSRNHLVYATVRTDDTERPSMKFSLTWNALSRLSAADPNPLSIEIPQGGTVQRVIEFRGYQEKDSPDAALSVKCADPLIRILSVTSEPGASRPSGLKEVRYKALIETTSSGPGSRATQLQWLVASIDSRYECRVPLRITEDCPVKVIPAQVFLRSQVDCLGARIALESSVRFRVLEASVTPEKWRCDIVLPEEASESQQVEIRVHRDSLVAGAISGRLRLRLDHADQQEIDVPISGYVRPIAP